MLAQSEKYYKKVNRTCQPEANRTKIKVGGEKEKPGWVGPFIG
jgi:hypothetical protein